MLLLKIIVLLLFFVQVKGVYSKNFLIQLLLLVVAEICIIVILKESSHQYADFIDAALVGAFMIPTLWHLSKIRSNATSTFVEPGIAYSIFENTSEAMLVCTPDNQIISVNPAFTEITGYHPEEIIGKTPKVLSSGRHSQGFYRDMWNSIMTTGKWQGEIWNRRKNGEEYAEWLTINSIHDNNGNVHRRIGLFSDISIKKRFEKAIWEEANFDQLTKLPNRRFFEKQLENLMQRTQQDNSKCAVLFVDLDGFKEINDSFGHQSGDCLLIEVAIRLQKAVRTSDTVARLGGDEYTIILPHICDKSAAGRIAESILHELSLPFELNQNQVFITASIGIAFYPDDAITSTELLHCSDMAMYDAKTQGKNRANYFIE